MSRCFARSERENMVRRLAFGENERDFRDLLVVAFLKVVSCWTAEELGAIDTQDLLTKTGEADSEAAIAMMKLLLDTVEDNVQERHDADQLLGWDIDGLLREPTVQEPLAAENRRLLGPADLPMCLLGH